MSAALDADITLRQGRFTLNTRFCAPGDGITALFGPSGSGKSTLLAALAGLKRPDTGYIRLGDRVHDDGRTHLPPHQRGIGLIFQDARLFPHLTVRQNIAYAWRRAPRDVRLEIADVARFFDIESLQDRPVTNLSGGEKSRVALARAVVSRPDFLLLDEPFAALDGSRRRSFIQMLLALHRTYRLPMMIVTHNIDDAAAIASHLVVLKDGAVVASGDFAATSRQPEFFALLDARDVGAEIPASALRTAKSGDCSRALWLRADQVLLAAEMPRAISARNILEGEVRSIIMDGEGSRLVALATASGTILSRVTPEAVNDLGLAVGRTVWALVKAHSL